MARNSVRLQLAVGTAALLLGAGCESTSDPEPDPCGDGVCQRDEGPLCGDRCEWDCTASCGAYRCGPLEIYFERICLGTFAPGRYSVSIMDGVVPSARTDTTPWDSDGPPDPYIRVRYGAVEVGSTQVAASTLAPAWSETLPAVELQDLALLTLDVFDDDGAIDEPMFSCSIVDTDYSSYGYTYQCGTHPWSADHRVRLCLDDPDPDPELRTFSCATGATQPAIKNSK